MRNSVVDIGRSPIGQSLDISCMIYMFSPPNYISYHISPVQSCWRWRQHRALKNHSKYIVLYDVNVCKIIIYFTCWPLFLSYCSWHEIVELNYLLWNSNCKIWSYVLWIVVDGVLTDFQGYIILCCPNKEVFNCKLWNQLLQIFQAILLSRAYLFFRKY